MINLKFRKKQQAKNLNEGSYQRNFKLAQINLELNRQEDRFFRLSPQLASFGKKNTQGSNRD